MGSELSTTASTMLSILMLAAGGMIWMGITMIRKGDVAKGDKRRGILMIVCALVMFMNVVILTA